MIDNIALRLSTVKEIDDAQTKLGALSGRGVFLICIAEGKRGDTIRELRQSRLLEFFDEIVPTDSFDPTHVYLVEDAATLTASEVLGMISRTPLPT